MIRFEIYSNGDDPCSVELIGDETTLFFELAYAVDVCLSEMSSNEGAHSYNYMRRALDFALDQVHQMHNGDDVRVNLAAFRRYMKRFEKKEDAQHDLH